LPYRDLLVNRCPLQLSPGCSHVLMWPKNDLHLCNPGTEIFPISALRFFTDNAIHTANSLTIQCCYTA